MKNTWYSFLPLLLVTMLALALGVMESRKEPDFFSANSLDALRELNFEHQMRVDDLLNTEDSLLVSELVQANAFLDAGASGYPQGLVVSLSSDRGVLLLQPVEELSEVELQTVAGEYKEAIPEFEEVEIDQELDLSSPFYDWNFPFIGEKEEPATEVAPVATVDLAEETIQVAVIDSGVDITHEIFANVQVSEGWNTLEDNDNMYDDVGHGTHVAGIIASDAPGVEIIPYKIVDANGGKLSNVLEAMAKALGDDVEIMNTSFGLSSPSYALEAMVERAYEQGVIIVSAAGNNAATTGFYPAEYAHTIAVASVDTAGNKLPKSNYGDWVDVAAYGYHVRSSLPDGQYGYKTGTSQAAPVVTAAVARLLLSEHTGELTFEGILSALKASNEVIIGGELAGTPIIK
ncbi:MAG: S8 family serine peptidase [Candidatus Gracilibacteria bacterium]